MEISIQLQRRIRFMSISAKSLGILLFLGGLGELFVGFAAMPIVGGVRGVLFAISGLFLFESGRFLGFFLQGGEKAMEMAIYSLGRYLQLQYFAWVTAVLLTAGTLYTGGFEGVDWVRVIQGTF